MGNVIKCTQAPCGKPAVEGILQFCPEDKRAFLPPALKKLLTPKGYVVGGRFCREHLDYFAGYSRSEGETVKIVSLQAWENSLAETEMGRRLIEQE